MAATAALSEAMHMEWTPVELEPVGEAQNLQPEPLLAGLEAQPADLHAAFLTEVDHLVEPRAAHGRMKETVGAVAEAHFDALGAMQGVEAAVSELGGHREGDALVLPLSGALEEGVHLDLAVAGERTALRLRIEGEDDVLERSFTLPPGTELARAGWRGDALVLDLLRR